MITRLCFWFLKHVVRDPTKEQGNPELSEVKFIHSLPTAYSSYKTSPLHVLPHLDTVNIYTTQSETSTSFYVIITVHINEDMT